MGEVEFKEFRLGDLLERVSAKYKGKGNPKDSLKRKKSEEYSIPVTYAKTGDNGIMYWGKPDEWEFKDNVVGVIYNGAVSSGLVYPHRRAAVLGESYLIKVKERYGVQSLSTYQYLSTKIEKVTYQKYSREYLATWGGKVEDDVIELPVTPEGEPDFEYMENYIKELEQKYIRNLKQKLETDKTNLLKVIGKSEEDIEEVLKTGFNEASDFKEFKLSEVFKKESIQRGKRIVKNDRKPGRIPLVTAGKENYGVSGYIKEHTAYSEGNVMTIDMFGNVFYREYGFFFDDNIIVFDEEFTKGVYLYLTSTLSKLSQLHGYSKQFRYKDISDTNVTLPINPDGTPDFQYMERYISYIELAHTHNFIETERKRIELIEELVEGRLQVK